MKLRILKAFSYDGQHFLPPGTPLGKHSTEVAPNQVTVNVPESVWLAWAARGCVEPLEAVPQVKAPVDEPATDVDETETETPAPAQTGKGKKGA